MPSLPRRAGVAALCLFALGACTAGGDAVDTVATAPPSAAAPPPAPVPTATVEPDPISVPFDVGIERVVVRPMDNRPLFGGEPRPDEVAGERFAAEVVDELTRYLDTQFVDEATRFGPAGIERLTGASVDRLTDEQRAGLGALDLDPVATVADSARVIVEVQQEGGRTIAVTTSFTARMAVHLEDGSTSPLRSSGDLVWSRVGGRWIAGVYDVELSGPSAEAAR